MAPTVQHSFASTTTFHGVNYVFLTDKKLVKLFWILVLVSSTCISVSSIMQVITEYLNAPVAVSISNVQNATLELPDLVICPIRGINASRLVEDGMPLYLVDLIMSDYGVDIDWKSLDGLSSNLSKKESSKNEFNQWLSSHNLDDYKDLLLNYSYNPDEFIHQIYFSDEDLNHVNLNDSKLIVGYTNGVCSVYVTQQTVFWPGLAGGYQLTLKMSQRNIYDNSFTDGWQIGLSKPFEVAPSNYLRIPTNSAVDIEISRIEIHRFPSYIWPKSGILCKDSPDYKASDNCAGLAYSQAIKALCNCTYIRTPKDLKNRKSGDRVCNPIELNICFFNIYPMVKKETSRLQAECLPVCNEINFQSTMTHGEINREAILSKLNLPDTTKVSLVRISYSKMEYTVIKTYEGVILSTVVSNIGGQLGLWAGASVVSVVHLISFFPFWTIRLIRIIKTRGSKKIDNSS